jgi:iron complex outermembrane receptor protein
MLFHSDLTEPIVFDGLGVGGYTNGPDTTLDGLELEYQHRFGSRIKVDANLSYVDARRQVSDDPLPGGPSLLGNLALLWQATDRWTAALQLRYVGPRDRDAREERPSVNGQTQTNLTLNWRAPHPGLQVHLGVKNLLNADIRYPSQFQDFDGVELTYLQDYPRPERRLWLSVAYSF